MLLHFMLLTQGKNTSQIVLAPCIGLPVYLEDNILMELIIILSGMMGTTLELSHLLAMLELEFSLQSYLAPVRLMWEGIWVMITNVSL